LSHFEFKQITSTISAIKVSSVAERVKAPFYGDHVHDNMMACSWLNHVCVCSTRLLPREGSLLFQNRNKRDILNTTPQIRITTHKQSLTVGSKHKHHTNFHPRRAVVSVDKALYDD